MKTISTFEDGRTHFIGKRFRCIGCGVIHQIDAVDEVEKAKFYNDFAKAYVACTKCKRVTDFHIDLPDPNGTEEPDWTAKGLYL